MAQHGDTSHDARVAQILALRAARPEARLAMAVDLSDSIRSIAAAGNRSRHPEFDPADVEVALAELYDGQAGARW
jgi:hypothetical protein